MVSRLKRGWDEEYRSWCRRSLADDWLYVWADGLHSGPPGAADIATGADQSGDKTDESEPDRPGDQTVGAGRILLRDIHEGTNPAPQRVEFHFADVLADQHTAAGGTSFAASDKIGFH